MRSPNTLRPDSLRGFTLIEVVIVTALFGFLLSLGLLMGMEVLHGTSFRSTREVLVSTLATARSRALANLHQSPHGVCYDPMEQDLIIFRGTTYDEDDETNERIPATDSGSITSDTDFFTCEDGTGIVFAQLSARTDGGELTVEGEAHASETVEVNEEGTLLW